MGWQVQPPEEKKKDEATQAQAQKIKDALRRPNVEQINSYTKFINAVVTDILVLNVAAIERQPQIRKDTQPFWLWPVNANIIKVNPDWAPDNEGFVPRYYEASDEAEWVPLMNKDLFLIQKYTTTWEMNPPSPLEVAFMMIVSWLGLSDWQSTTTSKATQEYILDLGEVTKVELDSFREFWKSDVQASGEVPIIAGKGKAAVIKLGAASDEGLYLRYSDYLLKIIALSFSLSWRDMNITDAADNRATAGVAADATFQDAILPMALMIQEHLQIEVIDLYTPGFKLKYNDTEPRNESEEAANANTLFAGGVITKNEARIRVNEEPLEQELGDRFFDGSANDPKIQEEEKAVQEANAVQNKEETRAHEQGLVAQKTGIPSVASKGAKPTFGKKGSAKLKGLSPKGKEPVAVAASEFEQIDLLSDWESKTQEYILKSVETLKQLRLF